ncbi:MAG: hypothetical protein JW862_19685 [Anaerolineales bacterium]|nr:hypothetical protein [Anaerolineales bacterium]
MRKKTRLLIVLLLMGVLWLATTLPVSARAEKIPVQGTCTCLAFLDNPDFRYWIKPDGTMEHWRYNPVLFYCDYNDPRLDGYLLAYDSWNTFANDNTPFYARTFGKAYSADEDANIVDLWSGSYHAYYDQDLNYFMDMTWIGSGENQGLVARLDLTFASDAFPVIDVVGELLDPNP